MPNEDLARFRQAVRNDPLNPELRYLLGAELAQGGDYEQAVIEMSTAIELKPDLHAARFQLGLLHLTLEQPGQSLAVWAAFDELPESAYFRLFKQGLEALIREDFPACVRFLEQGMAANTANPPLNHDMELILGKLRAMVENKAPKAAKPQDLITGVRTDFSLYSPTRQ
jgi:tetratricopeptide (TPR) repeat protein